MFSFINQQLLIIDIGTYAIKIAVMSAKPDLCVHMCDFIKIDKRLINEQGIILQLPAVCQMIKQMMDKYKIKAKKVVFSIPNHLIIKDSIQLNKELDAQEVAYQLELEASRMLPSNTFACMDYMLSKSANESGLNQNYGNSFNQYELDVNQFDLDENTSVNTYTVFATNKELIEQRQEIAANLKLKPYIIDSDFTGMLYACNQHESTAEENLKMLLHFGHSASKLCIMQGQSIVFEQRLMMTGKQLHQQLIDYSDLNEEQIILLKHSQEANKNEIIQSYIENIAIDVVQAIQNFFSVSRYNRIDSILASGGHSLLNGLMPFIAQKTQINTQLLNPFVGLNRSVNVDEAVLKKHLPLFANVIGLGLRAIAEEA